MDVRNMGPALRITLLYFVLGCLWIIITDKVLLMYISDVESMRLAQSLKGWFYVSGTALLLYFLVRNSIKKHDRSKAEYLSKLEKALERAEESNRLKTAFLNNLSHEIRTPMNAIIGFSELLGEDDGERQSEYVANVRKSSYRLLNIINDIISIATIESDQEKLLEERTSLSSLLEEIDKEFCSKASEKGLGFKFDCTIEKDKQTVFADRDKLRHVIKHLLGNAIKFTSSGSVGLKCSQKGGYLHFEVSDTGRGIPDDIRDDIFKRFRKSEYVSKSELNEGMGLGLPIARAYIELMGGKIEVSSSPGKGSLFSFSVPFKPVSGSFTGEGDSVSQASEATKGSTILVAEDEYSNFMLLETILVSYGFELIHAKNGREAIEAVRNIPEIALVLMDIKMPVMNGMEATRLIKIERPSLPVIAITAYALKGDEEKILACGCDGYLAKPLRKSVLLESVGRYVSIG